MAIVSSSSSLKVEVLTAALNFWDPISAQVNLYYSILSILFCLVEK